MGVDTCKLTYTVPWSAPMPLRKRDTYDLSRRLLPLSDALSSEFGWSATGQYGSVGPVQYQRYELRREVCTFDGKRWREGACKPLEVVVKGVGSTRTLIWEGSVPKYLGIEGACEAECINLVDRHIRMQTTRLLPAPTIRRLDVTCDCVDLDGVLRAAALGWNPHERSRYVQARYQDDETVWQHNKSRGVRVYDKFAECGEEWARGITRVEYQVRGDWCKRLGLDRLYWDLGRNAEAAIEPLVTDLWLRAAERSVPPTVQVDGTASERTHVDCSTLMGGCTDYDI